MFRTPVAEPAPVDVVPADLVPLSVLALDIDPPSLGAWIADLRARGITVLVDDLGRNSITRADARRLITERREAEARRREVVRRQEEQAVEADRVRRASIWPGIPAVDLPPGVSAASAMFAADRDAQPKRTSVLQEALSGESMTYHRLPSTDEE